MGAACAAPATPGWEAAVRKADASYWEAYGRRDPAAINAFVADDVEFYHDRGGTLMGKAERGKANAGMKPARHTCAASWFPAPCTCTRCGAAKTSMAQS